MFSLVCVNVNDLDMKIYVYILKVLNNCIAIKQYLKESYMVGTLTSTLTLSTSIT